MEFTEEYNKLIKGKRNMILILYRESIEKEKMSEEYIIDEMFAGFEKEIKKGIKKNQKVLIFERTYELVEKQPNKDLEKAKIIASDLFSGLEGYNIDSVVKTIGNAFMDDKINLKIYLQRTK